MNKAQQLKGKILQHDDLGNVFVKGVKPGSRTIVIVQIMDRGEGWHEIKERYTGIKTIGTDKDGNRFTNWSRMENKNYNSVHEAHINTLT